MFVYQSPQQKVFAQFIEHNKMAVSKMIFNGQRSKIKTCCNHKKTFRLDYQIGIPDWLTKYIKKMTLHNLLVKLFINESKTMVIKFLNKKRKSPS